VSDSALAETTKMPPSGPVSRPENQVLLTGWAYCDGERRGVVTQRDGGALAGGEIQQRLDVDGCGDVRGLADAGEGQRIEPRRVADQPVDAGAIGGLGDADGERSQGWLDGFGEGGRADQWPARPASHPGFWSAYDIVHCADGKARRFEPGSFPLAHGIRNRVGLLRGYGNAIVPQVAAIFIRAFLDSEKDLPSA
jgi:DNA (cytosine-5)-methyltransferase 1